jgi:hypothetical protein
MVIVEFSFNDPDDLPFDAGEGVGVLCLAGQVGRKF